MQRALLTLLALLVVAVGASTPALAATQTNDGEGCQSAETGRCKQQQTRQREQTALTDGVGRVDDFTAQQRKAQKLANKKSSASPPLGTGLSCAKAVRGKLGTSQRVACEESGASFLSHPIDNFKLDEHNNGNAVDGLLGGDGDPVKEAITDVQNALWMAWVWIIYGLLSLLEWASHLDQLTMRLFETLGLGVKRVNGQLGQTVNYLAITLLVAAFGVSLARGGRTGSALKGAGESWLYIIITLAIVAAPAVTLGGIAKGSGELNRTIMGATTPTPQGAPKGSAEAKSSGTLSSLGDTLVVRTWALANFSDPGWAVGATGHNGRKLMHASGRALAQELCDYPSAATCDQLIVFGDGKERVGKWFERAYLKYTPADIWLAWPPGDKGVRNALYEYCRDHKEHPCHSRILIQQGGAVYYPRGVVVLLSTLSLIGAALLFLVISCHLLAQVAKGGVLLLLAPIISVAAACGDWGRAKWRQWALALLSSLLWGAVAALFLTIVAFVLAAISAAATTASNGSWMIYLAIITLICWSALIWYGVNLYRRKFGSQAKWQQAAKGRQKDGEGVRAYRHTLTQMRTGTDRHKGQITTPLKAITTRGKQRRADQAHEQLREGTKRTLTDDATRAQDWAQNRKPQLMRERRSLDTALKGYDRKTAEATATGQPVPKPSPVQAQLLARRDALERELASPNAVQAEALHRDVNRMGGQIPEPLLEQRKERRLELAKDRATKPTDPSYLQAIGLYNGYRGADQAQRARLGQQAERQLKADRTAARKIAQAGQLPARRPPSVRSHSQQDAPRRAPDPFKRDRPRPTNSNGSGRRKERRRTPQDQPSDTATPTQSPTTAPRRSRASKPAPSEQGRPGQALRERLTDQKEERRRPLR